jgi:hypothetical protein
MLLANGPGMIRIKLISVFTVSLLALGACGSDDKKSGKTGPDPNANVTPEEAALTADEKACEEFYKVQVAWTGRCGGILNQSQPAITRFRMACARELGAPGAEALRDARAACAAKMQEASCDEEIKECEVPAGSLADGAGCATRTQCQSKFCKLDNTGCGTCEKLIAEGGTCSSAIDCAAGKDELAGCEFKDRGPTGKCAVYKVAKSGQTCSAESLCDTKSHCDVADEAATSGKCLANINKGGTCDNSRACRPGLVCQNKKCAEKPKEGDACDAIDDCADGLACDSTCKPVVYVGAREACDSVHRCARGRCVQPVTQDENGQVKPSGQAACVDPLADGDACGDEQAQQGLVCDVLARCVGGKCILPNPTACQ